MRTRPRCPPPGRCCWSSSSSASRPWPWWERPCRSSSPPSAPGSWAPRCSDWPRGFSASPPRAAPRRAGPGELVAALLGLAVLFLTFAAGVGAAARGAWPLHRWARPAAIAFELLVIVFGFSVIGGSLWLGLACLVTAIAVIMGFFLPAVVDAYNRALHD